MAETSSAELSRRDRTIQISDAQQKRFKAALEAARAASTDADGQTSAAADGSSRDRPIRTDSNSIFQSITVEDLFHAVGMDAVVGAAGGKVGVQNIPAWDKIPWLKDLGKDASVKYLAALLVPTGIFEGDGVGVREIRLTARPLESTLFLSITPPGKTQPFVITTKLSDLNIEAGTRAVAVKPLFGGNLVLFNNIRGGYSARNPTTVHDSEINASLNAGFLVRFNGMKELVKGMNTVFKTAMRAAEGAELAAGAAAAPATGGASLVGGVAAAGATEVARATFSNALMNADWYVGGAWRASVAAGLNENGDVTLQAQRGKLQGKWITFNLMDMPNSFLNDFQSMIPEISAEPRKPAGNGTAPTDAVENDQTDYARDNSFDPLDPLNPMNLTPESYPDDDLDAGVPAGVPSQGQPEEPSAGAGEPPAPVEQGAPGNVGGPPIADPAPASPEPAAPGPEPQGPAQAAPAKPAAPAPQPTGGEETDWDGVFLGDTYTYATDEVRDWVPEDAKPDRPDDSDDDDDVGAPAQAGGSGGSERPNPDADPAPGTGPAYPVYTSNGAGVIRPVEDAPVLYGGSLDLGSVYNRANGPGAIRPAEDGPNFNFDISNIDLVWPPQWTGSDPAQ